MRPLPPHPEQMRELMGVADPRSTGEIKAAQKAAKANYAAELQAQMRANEEAKLRDRMERLGVGVPPPLQAPLPPGMAPFGGGPGSPPRGMGGGGMGFGGNVSPRAMGGPPPYGAPLGFGPPGLGPGPGQPSFGSPSGGAGPPMPPPWGQPPPYQGSPPPPLFPQPSFPPPYQPQPPMGGPFGPPSPNRLGPQPSSFMGGGGYGPQPGSFGYGPGPSFGGPPMGGFGGGGGGAYNAPPPPPPPPLLPGPAPPPGPGPNTLQRMEQQARKDQYRLELEAQIRDREERRLAEKARQRDEDMRKEAEMAAYAQGNMGRGGGGAPHRDAAGNIVTNLGQMNRGPPSPGRMGMGMGPPPMMGGGPPPMGMGMGPPPMGGMMPPPLIGSPSGGMGMGMGMGMGGSPPMMGGPPPMPPPPPPMALSPGGMGGPPPPMMGPGGPMDGPPGVMPNYRFRSDNPYITPAELDSKQRQARELQEALEQQIQEKRRAKEMEKQRELAEEAREEARLRADVQQLAAQAGDGDGGGPKNREEVVADAWEKARLEAEELKRNKFKAKRGGGGGARAGVAWGEGEGGQDSPAPVQRSPGAQSPGAFSQGGGGGGGGGFGGGFGEPPPPLASRLEAAAGRPSTPLVVEKVRQVAAAELAAVKQELAAEAAQLREVVVAQGQQVAALKSHAERMEAEAERAREQVAAMRVGLLHHAGSVGAGDGLPPPPAPPALVDIGLDLPPPAAMLRRSAVPLPVYDMGPAIPGVNSSAILLGNAAASSINAAGGGAGADGGRPGSVGLRSINPLEASMAAESVFIFPNGKELGRQLNAAAAAVAGGGGGAAAAAAAAVASPSGAAAGGLPFQSLQLESGALPTIVTSQELETGPLTPASQALPSTRGPGPAASLTLAPGAAAAPAAAPAAAAPAAAKVEESPGSPGLKKSVAAMPALEVDTLFTRNQEKLTALKGITELANGAASIEALDDFLARYAAQRPGLPDRTATPVLRLTTPPLDPAALNPAGGKTNGLGATAMYSTRANAVGPLPMGEGRVLSTPAGRRSPAAALTSAPLDASSSSLKLTRRNSFTGDRTLQEGVLSQCLVPEVTIARPKTGPEGGPRGSSAGGLRAASPMHGRPPMLPNNRYSNNGKIAAAGGPMPVAEGLSPSARAAPVGSGPGPGHGNTAPTPRPTRRVQRGSDDGSYASKSFTTSREGSGGGAAARPTGASVALSRSRSLSAAGGVRPEQPLVLPPPPEDTLDVEMRNGLGAGAAAAAQGSPAKRPASQPRPDPAMPPFAIPRSPMLAGRLSRPSTTASQR